MHAPARAGADAPPAARRCLAGRPPSCVDAMAAELGEEAAPARVDDPPRGVADRLPGAGRVRQPAGRPGGGVSRQAPPAREGAGADRRGARRPRGDLAGADQPARGRGPARPRRAAPEAGGGGDLRHARPGRGVRARGGARRRDLRWDLRGAHPAQRARGRGAHSGRRPLHGRGRGPARRRSRAARSATWCARAPRCCAAGSTPRRSAPSCTPRSSSARGCTGCSPSDTRSPDGSARTTSSCS